MKFLRSFSASILAAVALPTCSSFQVSSAAWGLSARQGSTPQSTRLASTTAKVPGSAQLDTPWEELGFEFRPTNSHVKVVYKDGAWQEPELVKVSIGYLFPLIIASPI